jgi:hypothetical protein
MKSKRVEMIQVGTRSAPLDSPCVTTASSFLKTSFTLPKFDPFLSTLLLDLNTPFPILKRYPTSLMLAASCFG